MVNSKSRKAIILVSILLLVIGAAYTIYSNLSTKFDVPIPKNWIKSSESGNITSGCLGAWTECGSIERNYITNTSPAEALQDLRSSLAQKGWILETSTRQTVDQNTINATAINRPSGTNNRIAEFVITQSKVQITFIKK